MPSSPNYQSIQTRTYWTVSHMFKNNRELRPIECYGETGKWGENMKSLKYGHTLQCDTKIFVNIIITDYLLRETVQQEETVNRIFREVNADQKRQLCQYENEPQDLRHKHSETEQSFYLFESMLPLAPM
ncbi:hypothetical protein N7471_012623 [Penicillium samsonianum]|uniref:uncharacterized protein n=1 Tax=Penicillium samsonianum TaxID=1882272 RepID=UPI0025489D0D|nr:uncharacterized protein N7471_012623 [Penicillium samsonianum]KAJ6125306.1 hypothetical protein N7471_012623 [Penicillium samsonianum]